MITTRIQIESYLAEYVRGKYYDETIGTVRFPSSSDIYVTIYDLMEKRPVNCPADRGNLEFMLPDRREANFAGGKSPEQFNYISVRGTAILEKRLRALMWAELHELMDENKHLHGIEFKETVFTFLKKYNISSIQEDGLLKNLQLMSLSGSLFLQMLHQPFIIPGSVNSLFPNAQEIQIWSV